MLFEYRDASGRSSRTTNKDGADVATGDGGDGSPVETDPLRGNVGTSDPYIQLIPYSPKPEYPMLQPWGDESPQYINGQQVSVELDGIAVSLSVAMNALRGSADIDFARTDPWVLSNLGIYAVPREVGDTDADPPPGTPNDPTGVATSYGTTRIEYDYYFGNVSWNFTEYSFQSKTGLSFTTPNLEKCARNVANTIEPLETDNTLGANAVGWLENIIREGGAGGKYNVGTVAYAIATAYHETQNFTRIVESDASAKQNQHKYSGGFEYRGRGFVHLTHDDNYEKIGNRINQDLLGNPDLAARPDVAAKILFDFLRF